MKWGWEFHPFSQSRFGRNKDELSLLSWHICCVVLKENIFTTKHCPEQDYRLSSPRRNGSNEILDGQSFPAASGGWGPALPSGLRCHAELCLGWGVGWWGALPGQASGAKRGVEREQESNSPRWSELSQFKHPGHSAISVSHNSIYTAVSTHMHFFSSLAGRRKMPC